MSPLLRLIAGTVVLVAVYFAFPVRVDGSLALRAGLTALGIVLAAALITREMRRAAEAPLWGLALALVFGVLAFAMADYVIATSSPEAFAGLNTRLDALYFAITTLATVGFGDVNAQSQFARTVVTLQMVFNIVVLATAGSVLVNQIRSRRSARQQ